MAVSGSCHDFDYPIPGVVSTADSKDNETGKQVSGVVGTVLMDDLADRAPIFAAFYISPNRLGYLKYGKKLKFPGKRQ